jgi:DNA recombination protein RmuC
VLLAIIILAALLMVTLSLLVLLWRHKKAGSDSATLMLKTDLVELTKTVDQLKDSLQKQLSEQLGANTKQISAQFAQHTKVILDVTKKLTELERTNKSVGDIAADLKTLQNILQNPKQRGGIGEIQLQTVLENILPPGVFEMQYQFKDGTTVDAVIFLDKQILPIDSKFSLENYNRLLEEKDRDKKKLLTNQFKADVKRRIDETSKYIRPKEKTTDFAFMFIPSEAIYYDLLANKMGASHISARNLIDYAYQTKRVIIVSPTTFLAYLQAVAQGLRSFKIGEQAKEIIARVSDLSRHLVMHEANMQKLGASLGTTVNHFNNAHKELKKVDKDIVKIASTSPGVEPLMIDRPTTEE